MSFPLKVFDPSSPPRDLAGGLRFRLIGILGAALVRLWGRTLRIEWLGREEIEAVAAERQRVVGSFWHRHLLTLTYTHRGRGIVVLVSRHKDGEIISQIICRLGYGVVRGSTTRGGARALVEMVRIGRAARPLAVTPDGPRGPREQLQGGILHIAQRTGLPVVPLAVEGLRTRELDSWDRFQIPYPFTRVAIAIGFPIRIPQGIDAATVESEWGPIVIRSLQACEDRVAEWRAAHRKGGSARR